MEDPLSEEILRGGFKGKDFIRITVVTPEDPAAEKHLYFDATKQEESKSGGQLAQAGSDAT